MKTKAIDKSEPTIKFKKGLFYKNINNPNVIVVCTKDDKNNLIGTVICCSPSLIHDIGNSGTFSGLLFEQFCGEIIIETDDE